VAEAMLKDKQICHAQKKQQRQTFDILKKNTTVPKNVNNCTAKDTQNFLIGSSTKSPQRSVHTVEDPPWHPTPFEDRKDFKPKERSTEGVHATDSAFGMQLKQTAKAPCNTIDDLDDKSSHELTHIFQGQQPEKNLVMTINEDWRS